MCQPTGLAIYSASVGSLGPRMAGIERRNRSRSVTWRRKAGALLINNIYMTNF